MLLFHVRAHPLENPRARAQPCCFCCGAAAACHDTSRSCFFTMRYNSYEELVASRVCTICFTMSMAAARHSYAVFTTLRPSASTFPTKKVSFKSPWQLKRRDERRTHE